MSSNSKSPFQDGFSQSGTTILDRAVASTVATVDRVTHSPVGVRSLWSVSRVATRGRNRSSCKRPWSSCRQQTLSSAHIEGSGPLQTRGALLGRFFGVHARLVSEQRPFLSKEVRVQRSRARNRVFVELMSGPVQTDVRFQRTRCGSLRTGQPYTHESGGPCERATHSHRDVP